MKVDPNSACVVHVEHRGWAIIHDLVAHPFMAITGYGALARRFHDFTSPKAWPR